MTDEPIIEVLRIYKDEASEWRWSGVAGNGEPVADSGEGYVNKQDAIDAGTRIAPDARVQVEDD